MDRRKFLQTLAAIGVTPAVAAMMPKAKGEYLKLAHYASVHFFSSGFYAQVVGFNDPKGRYPILITISHSATIPPPIIAPPELIYLCFGGPMNNSFIFEGFLSRYEAGQQRGDTIYDARMLIQPVGEIFPFSDA